MKSFILICILLGLSVYGFTPGDKKITSWDQHRLKGKVKTIKYATYTSADNLIKGYESDTVRYSIGFNIKGDKIKDSTYPDTTVFKTSKFIEPFNSQRIVRYGGKAVYKYDKNKFILEMNNYSSDGKLNSVSKFKYDKMGEIIEQKIFTPKGKLKETYTFEYNYDKKGNWIKCKEIFPYKADEITERDIEYFSDAKGK
jgi:hypothetical protein